jgi:hypothetical protein
MIPLLFVLAFQELVLAQLGVEIQVLGNSFLAAGILFGIWRAQKSARPQRGPHHNAPIVLRVDLAVAETPRSRAA